MALSLFHLHLLSDTAYNEVARDGGHVDLYATSFLLLHHTSGHRWCLSLLAPLEQQPPCVSILNRSTAAGLAGRSYRVPWQQRRASANIDQWEHAQRQQANRIDRANGSSRRRAGRAQSLSGPVVPQGFGNSIRLRCQPDSSPALQSVSAQRAGSRTTRLPNKRPLGLAETPSRPSPPLHQSRCRCACYTPLTFPTSNFCKGGKRSALSSVYAKEDARTHRRNHRLDRLKRFDRQHCQKEAGLEAFGKQVGCRCDARQ